MLVILIRVFTALPIARATYQAPSDSFIRITGHRAWKSGRFNHDVTAFLMRQLTRPRESHLPSAVEMVDLYNSSPCLKLLQLVPQSDRALSKWLSCVL